MLSVTVRMAKAPNHSSDQLATPSLQVAFPQISIVTFDTKIRRIKTHNGGLPAAPANELMRCCGFIMEYNF
ncbi:hypothetical protein Y1Q_0016330 [Alligator mississippiensis]|uniref:Uncharacterized protein n=1 Tax=Alligator mississippiensis TaxID=8496 RepID=A0A151N2E2_ALLMI|nr:hypothetical protein Y1Q_0016330 [Alligator mississippiensis]